MKIQHYENVKKAIGSDTALCVVSKMRSEEEILAYYNIGERIFAENRAQELITKAKDLPKDIQWHFIGHLQTNKVRQILPYVSCIQSLDSEALADEIEKQAAKLNKTVDVLLEFHMAEEDTGKTGHDPSHAEAFAVYAAGKEHLHVCGIMVMGPHTDNEERIAEVFTKAKALYDHLNTLPSLSLTTLSMGMSADYKIAVQCGSTMVRIGTYLFAED